MNAISDQFGSALVATHALEWLKKSPIPILNQLDTGRYKAFIGFIMALCTTVGLHYTFSFDTRDLTIHIPTMAEFIRGVYDLMIQWAMQQGSYNLLIKPQADKTDQFVSGGNY